MKVPVQKARVRCVTTFLVVQIRERNCLANTCGFLPCLGIATEIRAIRVGYQLCSLRMSVRHENMKESAHPIDAVEVSHASVDSNRHTDSMLVPPNLLKSK